MFYVMKYESKRFIRVFIVIAVIYILVTQLWMTGQSERVYRLGANFIQLFVIGVALYPTVSFLRDEFSSKKLLYMKSQIHPTKQILGKISVVFMFATIALVISTLLFNIRVMIYKQNHELEYIRMNLDYVSLLLIDKSPKEWFYPINFLLNIVYWTTSLFTFANYYRAKSIITSRIHASLEAFVVIILSNIFIFKMIVFINDLFPRLDYNYLSKRVKAISLVNGEINFLSLISIIGYSAITVSMIYYLSNEKREERL